MDGWAKAPGFADRPDMRARLRAATEADRRAQLTGGLRPVSCAGCGITVLVKKNSPGHTSVQWTGDASACPELAGSDRPAALVEECSMLRETIAERFGDADG